MPHQSPQQPAIDGWFTVPASDADGPPRLIGGCCGGCGTYVFPPRTGACPNPACAAGELEPAELSERGHVWSFTENHYPPPAPFVAADPFEPYALAAVELEAEGLIVLGQMAHDVRAADLRIGMEVRLDLHTLYHENGVEYLSYVWVPIEIETEEIQ